MALNSLLCGICNVSKALVLGWQARGTDFERAQVPRLRDFLLKIAVRVKATVRRVVLHLP